MNVEQIASICHEANRLYCEKEGLSEHHLPWSNAPDWQKDSAMKGVEAIMLNPMIGPADSHANWYAHKVEDGWTYGPVKDPAAKTHPCMVPYGELPVAQRVKDTLFVNIVRALMSDDVVVEHLKRIGMKDFDPAAEIVVGAPVQEGTADDADPNKPLLDPLEQPNQQNRNLAQQGTQEEQTNGHQAEGQRQGDPAQADRDGREAASGEGGGTTEAGEVNTDAEQKKLL